MKKALLYIVSFLALQLMAGALVAAGYTLFTKKMPTDTTVVVSIITMVVFSLAAVALFLGLKWTQVSTRYVKTRPWSVLCWSVLAALGAIVPSMAVQDLLDPQWPEWIQRIVDETASQFAMMMSTTGGYFVVCLLAPVAEELVFRGAVLRALLQWRPQQRWGMIALSALLFAVAHLNPAQMPHAFVVALLLGWMYERTGSVLPGIAYHWANNTAAFVLFRLYPDPSLHVSDVLGGSSLRVLMACVFSLCILVPAVVQLNFRMKRP